MKNKKNISTCRNLVILSIAKFLSGFASYVYDVGIVIYLYDETESVAIIGGFFISQFLPAFLLLLIGSIIDKYHKKGLMIVSNLLKTVIFLLLLADRRVWSIYLASFLMNLILEFESNTSSALMVESFSKESIFQMASVMNVLNSVSMIIGPICASILANYFDIRINLMINVLLCVVSAAIYGCLQMECQRKMENEECVQKHKNTSSEEENNRKKFWTRSETLSIFRNQKILFTVIFWNIFMLCIGIASPLEISMINNTLDMPTSWYGIGNMVEGLGMMAASFFVLGKIKKLKPENIISLGLFTAAFSYLVIGISGNIWIYFIGASLVGVTSTFCPLGFRTEIQIKSAPEIVGRTFTVARFSILLSRSAGALLAENLLNVFNIRVVYYGISGILIAAAVCYLGIHREYIYL